MKFDAYYTSAATAASLIGCDNDRQPDSVIDFACGDGVLLEAAKRRWPGARLYGIDLDPSVVTALAQRLPGVRFTTADFFSVPSRIWGRRKFDLVVLNPPFSCPGSIKVTFKHRKGELKCSQAMAFLLRSLDYLARDGRLLALIPSSCLTSRKDLIARKQISKTHSIEIIHLPETPRFGGCIVDVVAVRLTRSISSNQRVENWVAAEESILDGMEIVRGRRPNRRGVEVDVGGAPFVHTTELRNGHAELSRNLIPHEDDRWASGPSILIPRVGKPAVDKVCWLAPGQKVILSDCVYAIRSSNESEMRRVIAYLRSHPSEFRGAYVGTCAKYLTLGRLKSLLAGLKAQTTNCEAA